MFHDRSTVEVDGLALNPACGLGAKVGYEVADFLVGAVATDGSVGGHVCPSVASTQIVHAVGVHGSGADAVDIDAHWPEFSSHRLCHADEKCQKRHTFYDIRQDKYQRRKTQTE